MERKMIKKYADFDIDDCTLSQLLEDVQEAIENYGHDAEIERYYGNIHLIYYVPESDKAFEGRKKRAKIAKEKKLAEELKEFERLKKKLGK